MYLPTYRKNINLNFFVAITILMIVSLVIDRIVHKKVNRKLVVYFIICILLMYFATFIAGPFYIDNIFDA